MTVTASAGIENTDTSNENQTQSIGQSITSNLVNSVTGQNTKNNTDTTSNSNTSSTGLQDTTGVQSSNSQQASVGSQAQTGSQKTSTTQVGSQNTGTTQTGSSTSTTGSSQAALDAITENMNTATANSTDTSKTDALVSQILKQSAMSFAPTQTLQTGSGLYNSSTLSMLSDYAKAQATSQASESVLNYQTDQQQLAASGAANLANAQKTTTGSTSDLLNSIVNSGSSGSSVVSSLLNALTTQGTDTTGTSKTSGSTSSANNTASTAGTSSASTGSTDTTVAASQTGQNDFKNFGSGQSNGSSTTEKGSAGFSLSIACTALYHSGRFEKLLFLKSSARFNRLPVLVQDAYYCWGKPAARLITQKPDCLRARAVRWMLEHRAKREWLATAAIFLLTLAASVRLLWIKDIRNHG